MANDESILEAEKRFWADSDEPKQKQSDSELIRMLIVRVDELNKRVAVLEEARLSQVPRFRCQRCGGEREHWQIYCGAACSQMAEYERRRGD